MISCPTVEKKVIRRHYDLSTLFYRLLWGPHIHHGLWLEDEPIAQAQLQLIRRLSELASVQRGERVVDVGCGMGGSTIHLARQLGCDATGITLSPVQARWARWSARVRGLSARTRFECIDAEQADFPAGAFDVVWSIECTEHLFEKAAFFTKAARWLRPGGRIAICAWLAGDDLQDEVARQQVYDVCEGFFCPSLGSRDDYLGWLGDAGLEITAAEDWTPAVMRTWEICLRRVQRARVRTLARMLDQDAVMFLDRFDAILSAYQSGAMQYGCFVAQRKT